MAPSPPTARLSDLTLEGADGGEAITLSPAFDADTDTYTAAVVNRIDAVKLTATKNDDNAMVVITNDDDQTGSPEEAILDLNIGSNTLTVTVTAQDGNATRTYTVTATRATAPPAPTDCPSDTAWCTTMTLGYRIQTTDPLIYESVGYDGTQNYGDLGTATFTHGGTPYSVSYTVRVVTSWMDNTIQTEELFLLVKPELPDGSVFQVDNRTFTVDANSRCQRRTGRLEPSDRPTAELDAGPARHGEPEASCRPHLPGQQHASEVR